MPVPKTKLEIVKDHLYYYVVWKPVKFLQKIGLKLGIVSPIIYYNGILSPLLYYKSKRKPDPKAYCEYCDETHDPYYCSVAIVRKIRRKWLK